MKKFRKPICNLFIEEYPTLVKKVRDKRPTHMKKKLVIYKGFRHKTNTNQFSLSTDDPVYRVNLLDLKSVLKP